MAYLTRTPSSAGNRKTFTISAWLKPNVPGSGAISMFSAWSADNVAGHFVWRIKADGTIGWSRWSDDSYSTRKLLDTNAWYHCVIAVDTTQSTAADRVKLYVNNEQITSFSVGPNYPAQNTDLPVNNTNSQTIGLNNYSSGGNDYKGYMSHFHLVDGTALTPSAFGSTDATTGEWKINTSPSVTYGTCGFFMFKDDNSANDDSGQSNNFSLSGTLPKSEDCPSNVFNTLNPLAVGSSAPTFSMGNNRVTGTAGAYQFSCGTIAVPLTGKWYWEVKANDNVNGSSTEYLIGAVLESRLQSSSNFAEFAADGISQYGSVGSGIAQNDIIGVSVDRTAATLKIYKNNSLIVTKSSLPAELIFPMVTVYGSVSADANFGNGYFGGTAISSAGTNASNLGIFEYDVIPSDATAICTKGLNE